MRSFLFFFAFLGVSYSAENIGCDNSLDSLIEKLDIGSDICKYSKNNIFYVCRFFLIEKKQSYTVKFFCSKLDELNIGKIEYTNGVQLYHMGFHPEISSAHLEFRSMNSDGSVVVSEIEIEAEEAKILDNDIFYSGFFELGAFNPWLTMRDAKSDMFVGYLKVFGRAVTVRREIQSSYPAQKCLDALIRIHKPTVLEPTSQP